MAIPPDRYAWLRNEDAYTSSTSSAATSGTDGTVSGTFYDEGSTDSNSWYLLNNSIACIAPGTMVQMAGPGQIIPVRSMDDLAHDPRVIEEQDRRMRQEIANLQAQMEREVSANIGGSYQRGAQPRNATEMMLLTQQEQQQAQQQAVPPYEANRFHELGETMRRIEREIERSTGMYPLPEAPPPIAIAEGEEGEVRTHIPQSHYERMVGEREQAHEYLAEQQRRFAVQRAMMGPGSIDNNANYHYGVTFHDDPCDAPPPIISNEHMKRREKAEERAQELLGMIIGEEDLGVYKKTGNLYVKGKKYEYIIQKDGFILQLKKDRVVNLCCHLEKKNAMPLTDNVIAMKLRIENEEKDVLQLANEWGSQSRRTYKLPECAGMVA